MVFLHIDVCEAQGTYQLSQLSGTKWVICIGDTSRIERVVEFSNQKFKTTTFFKSINKSKTFEYDYYLSNTVPSSFHSNLVGKTTSGTYIVIWLKDELAYLRIESLSNNTLKLYQEKRPDGIGSYDVTLNLKKIE